MTLFVTGALFKSNGKNVIVVIELLGRSNQAEFQLPVKEELLADNSIKFVQEPIYEY